MSSSIEMKNEVSVNSLLMKSLESATREYARKCVYVLANEYGFAEEDALKILNLEKLKLQVQEMKKRSGGKAKAKEAKAKTEKPEKPVKAAKALFPLPFSKENVLESGCQGLCYDSGLFTQCPKVCIESLKYCKTCQSEIDQYGGTTNGTVAQRLGCELMEFKDPRGRKPVAYAKIMKKKNLTREQVEAEAGKLNISIDETHFVVGEKKTKAVKKPEVVEDDLLADLLEELGAENSDEDVIDLEVAHKKQQQADEKATKEAEVALKKQQQAEEVALKKQQQADEKAAKDAEVALKKQQQADEKAAKDAEKAAKAQQIADEKAAKDAEKAQKIAEEKALKKQQQEEEKALKKQQQEAGKKPKEAAPKEAKVVKPVESPVVEAAAPAKKVTVKRITIGGKQYLKTVENLLYDPETKEEMGIYDPETDTIKELPDDSEDELSEDDMSDDE